MPKIEGMDPSAPHDPSLRIRADITSAEADMFKRLRAGSLINYLIQAAVQSADSLGFGFTGLKNKNLFWVFSRLEMEINRALLWNEKVEVETWPKDVDGLLYLRDFVVRTNQGEVVARAASSWLAIDLHTKRPKKLDETFMRQFPLLYNKHGLPVVPGRIAAIDGPLVKTVSAEYSDIDLNRHVTSTRYVDWLMDAFSLDFHSSNYPKYLELNFLKETMLADTLLVRQQGLDEKKYVFQFENSLNQQPVFRAIVHF